MYRRYNVWTGTGLVVVPISSICVPVQDRTGDGT